jgi:hypothetical protein
MREGSPAAWSSATARGTCLRCLLCPRADSYYRRCPHGHICMIGTHGWLLHPVSMNVCESEETNAD